MDSAKTDTVHPFKVFLGSFFGDITVHPVPPDTGSCGLGRVFPTLLKVRIRDLRGRIDVVVRRSACGNGQSRSREQSYFSHRVIILFDFVHEFQCRIDNTLLGITGLNPGSENLESLVVSRIVGIDITGLERTVRYRYDHGLG